MTTATSLRQEPLDIALPDRMKALVYHGPGKRAWEDRPTPGIQAATDAVVRITTSTICGTDLHILKGDVPSVLPGRILGHEGVGVVQAVGAAVTSVRPGDRVIVSCITACGKCDYCRREMFSHCLLSDILPTGFECGVLSGTVKPGDTVAIVGAGPNRVRSWHTVSRSRRSWRPTTPSRTRRPSRRSR